jgi:hypothetical protein
VDGLGIFDCGLGVCNVLLKRELLSLLIANLSPAHVAFMTEKEDLNRWISLLSNILQPVFNMFE